MDTTVLAGPTELTSAWLSEVLGVEVAGFEPTSVGTGQVGETVRVALTYPPGVEGPPAVVAKFVSTDERSRAGAKMTRAYETEVSIYRELPPLPGVPRALHAAYDAVTDTFTLVLEDLSPCRPGDDLVGCDLATGIHAMQALARLHAAGWERADFAAHGWLNRRTPTDIAALAGLIATLAPLFLERFGSRLDPEHCALVERLAPRLQAVMTPPEGPRTLSHGDFRLDNMLFREGSADPSVVDWQTAVWGPPGSDAAYFVGGSLTPADRRTHSAALLDAYHVELLAAGVTGYPREQLDRDVRKLSLGGVVMAFAAAVLVVQTERGDAMFAELFGRHAQHALDLDAEGAIGEAPPDTSHVVVAADEGAHEPDAEPLWNESLYADVISADGSVAAYVRLGLYPNLGQAWWHAVVVGPDRPLVISDHTTLPVTGRTIDADGVRLEVSVDETLRTFSVRGTMTAARHADPADVYVGAPGEPVTVEIDATWHTDGVPYHYGFTTRYEIPCRVEGFVVVDGEKLILDGPGQRDHSWGVRDWWSFGWCWSSGHFDDGTHFQLTDVRLDTARIAAGYVQSAGEVTALTSGQVHEEPGDFPARATIEVGDVEVTVETLHWGPILLVGPNGETARFPRAAARVTTADGRSGTGWIEWNQPA